MRIELDLDDETLAIVAEEFGTTTTADTVAAALKMAATRKRTEAFFRLLGELHDSDPNREQSWRAA